MYKRALISLLVGVGLAFFDLISFEYTCEYSENMPKFYGFPAVYRTSSPFVNSLTAGLYLKGLIINCLFWSSICLLTLTMTKKIGQNVLKKVVHTTLGLFAAAILLFSTAEIIIIEWYVDFDHDNFKIHHFEKEPECERRLTFFPLK